MITKRCFAMVIALFLQGFLFFRPISAQTTPFADVSDTSGVLNNRRSKLRAIGQAWGDYDNDGWLDLYVTDPKGANTLYHNEGDGTFRVEMQEAAFLRDAFSQGAIFVDYDNDGWQDLYVLNWGANTLLKNENGRFRDVTAQAGVAGDANSQTASWGDFDQDGWLDLYVANWACYPSCGRPQTGERDRLYHSNRDGTFSDATDWLGVKTVGAGFVANFTDYDNDGDLDIYLVNDEFIHPIGNVLWRNDGAGCAGWCFSEVSAEANADTRLMGMGLATADFDHNGFLDYYFSNAGPMALLLNQGNGTFVESAEQMGVDLPHAVGWGTVAFDYDNDSWTDLYLAVMEMSSNRMPALNPLFRNEDGTHFSLVSPSGVEARGRSLGVAYADYDRDGWVDLVVGGRDDGYRLFRNQAHNGNNWLALQLVGGGPINLQAIGARVVLHTQAGKKLLQEVRAGSSLGAGDSLVLHFGLGRDRVVSADLLWPNGEQVTLYQLQPNQYYTLEYGNLPTELLQPTSADTRLTLIGTSLGITLWLALIALSRKTSRLTPARKNEEEMGKTG